LYQQAFTPILAVSEGDVLVVQTYQDSLDPLIIEADVTTFFSVLSVSGTGGSGGVSDPLFLSSGVFSESLTISGIPVTTGTAFNDTLTFYTASSSEGAVDVLNTVTIAGGLIESWTQA
jgi:hypothetical protein